ncbi:MAG: HAD family hydrolase, partial [Bacteroidaceae bacterium]|nr:HAD family hydrolase [Bacteroidaceae bacterium]
MANSSEIKRPKLLMFDYGGTLDTNGIHWSEVIWSQYQKENVPITKEQYRECYVYAERELAKQPIIEPDDIFLDLLRKKINIQTLYLVEHKLWSPEEVSRRAIAEHISLRCNNVVQQNIDRIRPLLRALAEKYRIVLVSNFYGNLNAVLKGYNLDVFENVVES